MAPARSSPARGAFLALLSKDARRELRSKEAVLAGAVLVLLFIVLFALALPAAGANGQTLAAVLWLPLVFGAAAVASRGLASETDRGTMDLLRAVPVSAGSHGWSRTVLHGAVLMGLTALTVLATIGLFGASPGWTALAALALGAVGLAVVATLASGLAAQARSRETLLPILLVPVCIPLLQAGLEATAAGLRGDPPQAAAASLLMMVAYDLLAIGVAWFLWDIILEAD